MALSDVDNAMRTAARAWALANGLAFTWDNVPARDGAAKSLVWLFRPTQTSRLTGHTARTIGVIDASIQVPAGSGLVDALVLAKGLADEFRRESFAGAVVLDEIAIAPAGPVGASFAVSVRIPWDHDERRVPQGVVEPAASTNVVLAYQDFRARWDSKVRAPLALPSFFDNSPEVDAAVPPWALVSWRTLEPVAVEMRTLRVPGRVIAALNYPSGIGVEAAETAIRTIVRAFDECSFRGVTFGTPVVTRAGRTPLDTWQANVRLPFHYEVRT